MMTDGMVYGATITGHSIKKPGETLYVEIRLDVETENGIVPSADKIFLSEKTMGRARKKLSACGFDLEHGARLNDLEEHQTLLAGNVVKITAKNEGKYGWKAEIITPDKASADEINSLDAILRAPARKKVTESADPFAQTAQQKTTAEPASSPPSATTSKASANDDIPF